jgi:hypothetical protein
VALHNIARVLPRVGAANRPCRIMMCLCRCIGACRDTARPVKAQPPVALQINISMEIIKM